MADKGGSKSLKKQLKAFLDQHPQSTLKAREDRSFVASPWGDPTVVLRIDPENDELIACLNSVLLPSRFSAIWHLDDEDLEFIFTAYPPVSDELRTRSFEFQTSTKSYRCEFGHSSDRLLQIARAILPVKTRTATAHRNLESIAAYEHAVRHHPDSEIAREGQPVSFWVRSIKYDESAIVEFARSLNFFMRYVDPTTPVIVIHPPPTPGTSDQYGIEPLVSFPPILKSSPLDHSVLDLWESGELSANDPFQKYIYLYQALEDRAFYHVQSDILRVIRRAITAPDASVRLHQAARDIMDKMTENRVHETEKFALGIDHCVDPATLWEFIGRDLDYFSKDVEFEGGFRVRALVERNSTKSTPLRRAGDRRLHWGSTRRRECWRLEGRGGHHDSAFLA